MSNSARLYKEKPDKIFLFWTKEEGKYRTTVNVNLPYHRIHDSGENLWSALVETGYLSKAVTENMPLMPLRIPNKEIQVVFREEIWNYFKDKIDNVHDKKCLIE